MFFLWRSNLSFITDNKLTPAIVWWMRVFALRPVEDFDVRCHISGEVGDEWFRLPLSRNLNAEIWKRQRGVCPCCKSQRVMLRLHRKHSGVISEGIFLCVCVKMMLPDLSDCGQLISRCWSDVEPKRLDSSAVRLVCWCVWAGRCGSVSAAQPLVCSVCCSHSFPLGCRSLNDSSFHCTSTFLTFNTSRNKSHHCWKAQKRSCQCFLHILHEKVELEFVLLYVLFVRTQDGLATFSP